MIRGFVGSLSSDGSALLRLRSFLHFSLNFPILNPAMVANVDPPMRCSCGCDSTTLDWNVEMRMIEVYKGSLDNSWLYLGVFVECQSQLYRV